MTRLGVSITALNRGPTQSWRPQPQSVHALGVGEVGRRLDLLGGPVPLLDALLNHPDLRGRVRRASLDDDATPPGHRAI